MPVEKIVYVNRLIEIPVENIGASSEVIEGARRKLIKSG